MKVYWQSLLRFVVPFTWGLSIVLLMLVAGCEWYGNKSRTWKEDVLLEDGSTIRIKRHVEFVDHNSWSGDAYGVDEKAATLDFPKHSNVPTWRAIFRPLVLYRDGAQWVIVSSTTSCEIWGTRGKPRPPYWEHRLVNGTWKEMSLSERSIGRVPNLFFSYDKRPPALVSVEAKQARLKVIGIGEAYLEIGRQPRWNCN